MPRLRLPEDIYNKARIIAGREGMGFRAWARLKALRYNGGLNTCDCTRAASIVVQVDADLPVKIIRSAIIEAVSGVSLSRGSWDESTIRNMIYIETFWGRSCTREQAIRILDKRLEDRVSSLTRTNKKTHRKEVAP